MRPIVCAASLLVACHAEPTTTTVATRVTVPPPPVASASSSSAAPASGLPSSDLFAAIPAVEGPWENRRVGFSNDDVYLGYEISTCDPCPNELHFESKTRPPLSLSYYYDPSFESAHPDEAEKRRKKNDAIVDAKIAELGVGKGSDKRVLRGPFPYPDVRFVTKTTRDDAKGTTTLWFGGTSSGHAPVFPMHVTLGPDPVWLTQKSKDTLLSEPVLLYANVTRDGADLGIVALASGTMWFETGDVARMPTAAFVAAVRASK
jgi:hypothetical protein